MQEPSKIQLINIIAMTFGDDGQVNPVTLGNALEQVMARHHQLREMHSASSQKAQTFRAILTLLVECANKVSKGKKIQQVLVLATKGDTESKMEIIGEKRDHPAGPLNTLVIVEHKKQRGTPTIIAITKRMIATDIGHNIGRVAIQWGKNFNHDQIPKLHEEMGVRTYRIQGTNAEAILMATALAVTQIEPNGKSSPDSIKAIEETSKKCSEEGVNQKEWITRVLITAITEIHKGGGPYNKPSANIVRREKEYCRGITIIPIHNDGPNWSTRFNIAAQKETTLTIKEKYRTGIIMVENGTEANLFVAVELPEFTRSQAQRERVQEIITSQ